MQKCKVCGSELREKIEKYMVGGASPFWMSDWCKDRKLNVSSSAIETHMVQHVVGYRERKMKSVEQVTTNQITGEPLPPEPTINLDSYLAKLGLSENELLDIENNLPKNIGALQSALNLIMFKNLCIVNYQMDGVLDRTQVYPMEKIKGLRSLAEIYFRATGVDTMISEDVAFKQLDARGYQISTPQLIDIESNGTSHKHNN